ncbi:argininosuccinate lyase [Planctomycetes bacterium Poly30]|uniref:Argininosuccinate lyase n=1 Tax=Saltatorellus ferox TaxID=2528018 RepID=A0A518ETW9_9BACT|nr:argininosuccinate lyase [Planctomycetes bacterium Poly30]
MTLNVVLISPSFPTDNGHFTKALHALPGVRVLGVGDQPLEAMEPDVRAALDDHLVVRNLWDEAATVQQTVDWLARKGLQPHRVECLWEPGVMLAARMRERFDAPGLRVEQARAFRDKETMKATLDAHGIRTPHHYRASTGAEVQEAAAKVGYPLIVKPIDGAGSADTYVVRTDGELEGVLVAVKHVPEVSVEEFIEGEEFTYDAILSGGRTLFENVAWYRPKPLVARQNPWISPQAVCLSDIRQDDIAPGVELGRRALKALGLQTGMAHMEWYRSAKTGEAIFGEVGARAPGGRLSHGMNLTCDGDVFRLWAEAITSGETTQKMEKQFNAALVFKRATGNGNLVTRIEGLERVLGESGEHIPVVDLVPIGQPRRDWTQVVTGDGWMVARHVDLGSTLQIADRLAQDVRILCDG